MNKDHFRLVCQIEKHHWGSAGLELVDRYYILQVWNEISGEWNTVNIVDIVDLPESEKQQIQQDMRDQINAQRCGIDGCRRKSGHTGYHKK